MEPSFRQGDWLVVLWGGKPRIGRVVVAAQSHHVGQLVIKRVIRQVDDPPGWWLEGDNSVASSDSRQLGPYSSQQIRGRVLFRYRRGAKS